MIDVPFNQTQVLTITSEVYLLKERMHMRKNVMISERRLQTQGANEGIINGILRIYYLFIKCLFYLKLI